MSFTRDDIKAYEAQTAAVVPDTRETLFTSTPEVKSPESSPQVVEPKTDSAISVQGTEPTEKGTNDGSSTTVTPAESVAATPASDPEGVSSESEDPSNDGKPRNRAQERIEELVAERNALRKYGEYLLGQVDTLRKGPAEAGNKQDSQPVATETSEDLPPTLEDAQFDPVKHTQMQNQWMQKQIDKRVNSAVQQLESRQSEVATRQVFENRVAEFRKTAPDFDLVVANPALPSLAKEAIAALIKSENGPAVVYHLAKNPDMAARVARLDPVGQAISLGRLEEQIIRSKTESVNTNKEPSKQDAKPVQPVKVTQAPPPPKPVQASTPPSKEENIMSMDEWVQNERAKTIKAKQERLALRKALR